MSASERPGSLTPLARLGFGRLAEAEALLSELSDLVGFPRDALLDGAAEAADPDACKEELDPSGSCRCQDLRDPDRQSFRSAVVTLD